MDFVLPKVTYLVTHFLFAGLLLSILGKTENKWIAEWRWLDW